MDSINKNQSETNHADLSSTSAAHKIKELATSAQTCFFCTMSETVGEFPTRPMSVREVDGAGNIWFLSAADSHKNQQIAANHRVTLYFQGSTHSDFMQLHGEVDITTDKATIQRLWNPIIKTWFTQGIDDPRITVLRFKPRTGYYWDNKHGDAVAGVKMMIGAVLGKTLDDLIEGNLRL